MSNNLTSPTDFIESCRPILFEAQSEQFPYWGKGSSFLIANSHAFYWITASHVLTNQKADFEALLIRPSDYSRISLPFNEKYVITKGDTNDEEYKDIFVLRVAMDEFVASGDALVIAQDIEVGALPAEDLKIGAELLIAGYPGESNTIDYDTQEIKNTRIALRGLYQGRSASAYCHHLKVESTIAMDSYDGLSGGPVFYMQSEVIGGQLIVLPRLVGMVLRGTKASSTVHFVSSTVLINIIAKAEGRA